MSITHVVGVDPGLVHTGVVSLVFDQPDNRLTVRHEAVAGPDPAAVNQAIADLWPGTGSYVKPSIFIEGYRSRSNFGGDTEMLNAVAAMKQALPGSKVLQNMGVKKVIRRGLMDLVGCWNFSTPTHHQDLRSAAYIALFGMVKDPTLNAVLTQVVTDHLAGAPWHVES